MLRSRSARSLSLTAAVALLAGGLSACAASAGADRPNPLRDCAASPVDCDTGPRRAGGTFTVALLQAPRAFNLAAAGASGAAATVLASVLPRAFIAGPDGALSRNTDLLTSAKVTRQDPQTVVYTLAPGAVWDDGTPISAEDFAYAWHTRNGRDCPACLSVPGGGYELIDSVRGKDRQVTVTFSQPYPDWPMLFDALYPAHVEGAGLDLSTPDGLAAAFARQDKAPGFSGGPYRIDDYQMGKRLRLVPNPRWYGADKPTLRAIVYRFLPDPTDLLAALQDGDVNAAVTVPNRDLVELLNGLRMAYAVTPGRTTQRLDINVVRVPDPAVRQAIFTAVDIDAIIDATVRDYFPAVTRLYSHNLLPGTPGYQEVIKDVAPGQGSGDLDAARALLTKAGYTVAAGRLVKEGRPLPVLRLRYVQGDAVREQAARLIRAQVRPLGVDIELAPTGDLATALDNADYDLALTGLPASPALGAARDLWATDGVDNHTGWGDPDSDVLLHRVTREPEPAVRWHLLNQQDGILTRAAVSLPLYLRPDLLALSGDFVNVRPNAFGYLSYNSQQWGLASHSRT